MLTDTPDTSASSYQCGFCGIYDQVLVPVTDENGSMLFRDDGTIIYFNDEPVAAAEINGHIEEAHPKEFAAGR